MKASEVWPGSEYAFVEWISRGVSYYPSAQRVQALRVYKDKDAYSERATTMVEVRFLNNETGEPRTLTDGREYHRDVRVRDLYARWEEHATEKKIRDERYAEQEEEYQRQRQERLDRIERERVEREARIAAEKARIEAERERLLKYLESRGIRREYVKAIHPNEIVLDRAGIEQWAGVKRIDLVKVDGGLANEGART
jgi:hypothetical protein